MSIDTKASSSKKIAAEIKSTSFNTPVLAIYNIDLKQIEVLLEEKTALAPEFFYNSPLVIDLQSCQQKKALDLSALILMLRVKKLFPIGISGGGDDQNSLALELNVPVQSLRGTRTSNIEVAENKPQEDSIVSENDTTSGDDSAAEYSAVENMFVSQPIRSGQRIYAKGDLTVLSHVSAGAEIMAEGNIHVYGSLRGRALAGVQGNTESRIFCSELKAELVSIAGHYKISEELEKTKTDSAVQIYLQDQSLIIKNL
jgi:septum site-determining protein MinC